MNAKFKNRLYLIDLFRLPVLISIGWFHLYNMNFAEDKPGAVWNGSFSAANFDWMRLFVPGGLVILGLSCFLFGYRQFPTKKIFSFIALFLLGALLLFFTTGDEPFFDTFLEWDIYHFLIVNFAVLYFISKSRNLTLFFGGLGFVLLSLPLTNHFRLENLFWQNILLGDCLVPGRGGWALLPWSGFVWFFFFLGRLCGHWRTSLKLKTQWWTFEFILWPILFVAAAPRFFAYHPANIAAGFYCDVFHHTPLEFWSYFIVIVFILRLAVMDSVNHFLEKQKFVRWISNLQWNQNLAFCYLLQLFYVSVLTATIPFGQWPLWVFDIFAFTMIPTIEIMMRGLQGLLRTLKSQGE